MNKIRPRGPNMTPDDETERIGGGGWDLRGGIVYHQVHKGHKDAGIVVPTPNAIHLRPGQFSGCWFMSPRGTVMRW
jgi:hypothetical protein